MVQGEINPHVLSEVPEFFCRSTWDLNPMTLLYMIWGSASVHPRMQQMIPICLQGWHGSDLFSWFGWSCEFGSSWCLSCLLPVVKLEAYMQHVSPVGLRSPLHLLNCFGGILHWGLWSEMTELNFTRFKRNFGSDGPVLIHPWLC